MWNGLRKLFYQYCDMAQTSYYSEEELAQLGLKSYGKGVLLSRHACLYGAHRISIGDNVRIDDFCILCGDVTIGSHIHIAPYCVFYGEFGIQMEDYSGLSAGVKVYSAVDDFSGEYAVGPMIDESKRKLTTGKVTIGKYVQVGAGSTIFPDVTIGEGSAVGAMSLVKKSLEPWSIYAGIPVRKLKDRSKNLLELIGK